MRKSVVMLMLLLIGLLAVASVSAADNITDDVVGIETNDKISVNNVDFNATDVLVSNDQTSSLEVDDSDPKNDNEEMLSSVENKDVLCDSPPYDAYSVDVSENIIDYGTGGNIEMKIKPASSEYSMKYDYMFVIKDKDEHDVVNIRYNNTIPKSEEWYYISPKQFTPGIYSTVLYNTKDNKQLDESILFIKSILYYTDYSATVNDTIFKYGESGNVAVDIVPASSNYYNKYNFRLDIFDSNGERKFSDGYSGTQPIYQLNCSIGSTYLSPGIYTIKLINIIDDYVMSTAKLSVFNSSNLKINANDQYVTEIVKINYSIDPKATGSLKIYLNNNYVTSVSLGNSIELGYLTEGNYTVKVVYNGDNYYFPCEKEASFKIQKLMSSFNFIKNDVNAGGNLIVECKLNNDAGGTLSLNGLTKQLTNGTANFIFNNIESGLHQFNISYSGDDKYYSISKSITVTIKSKEVNNAPNVQYPDFTFPKLIITTPYYKYSGGDIITYWTGNLNCYFKLYKGNKLIFNKYLTPYGSGVSTDDGYSEYSYLTKKLAIGSYTVKIIAPNGALYTKKSFKVTKMPTYIDCPNVKVKYGTTKYITVKVYRKLDNDWASGTVKFTINGKTYKAKLKQGVAKIKIKVPSKIKTYACKVKFLENSKYKGSSKKFKLIVKKTIVLKSKTTTKSVSLYTNAKHTLKVNVKDSDGNKIKSGTVKVKVNGKTYKAKISNGVAKVKITAPSKTGKYNCKATYTGSKKIKSSSTSFSITVKPRYVDIEVSVADGHTFTTYSGAYKVVSSLKITYTSNSYLANISITPYKNNKFIQGSHTEFWVHDKSNGWIYLGYRVHGEDTSDVPKYNIFNVDKAKVRIHV